MRNIVLFKQGRTEAYQNVDEEETTAAAVLVSSRHRGLAAAEVFPAEFASPSGFPVHEGVDQAGCTRH